VSKEKKIENIIRKNKARMLKYQFRMFIFYAFMMAFITSNGIESDNAYVKGVFFGLILVMCVALLRNLTRWLSYQRLHSELNDQLHEPEEVIEE
jgi:hypothetical protein